MSAGLRSRVAPIVRRLTQIAVVLLLVWTAFGGIWRNYKVAHNNERIVGLINGPIWARLYDWNERLLASWGEPYRASLDFMGSTTSFTLFGWTTLDPLFAMGHVAAARELNRPVLLAALIPILLAALLGKVFCSHLCPMRLTFEIGQTLRAGLLRLGVPLPHPRSEARFGGWVLLGGIVASALSGVGVWLLLLPYQGLAMGLFVLVTTETLALLLAVPAFWLLVDVFFAPGFFCHSLCPQGFLLEQASRWAPWRISKTASPECPSSCRSCQVVCPYALSPREETHNSACDRCGKCVSACPKEKLVRHFRLPVLSSIALACLLPATADAHHNKGLPHYGYYENYPQVPTEEHVVVRGGWEMGATLFNFQGYQRHDSNAPNDVKFFIYLYDLKTDTSYVGPVDFEIQLDGDVVTRFHRDHVDEERIYSTRETLPASGEYELVAHVLGADPPRTVRLSFEIDLQEDRINWTLVLGLIIPVLVLFGLAAVGRSKKGRSMQRRSKAAAIGSTTALVFLISLASVRADAGTGPGSGVVSPGPPGEGAEMSCGAAMHPSLDNTHVAPAEGHGAMKHIETADGGRVMVMGGMPTWLFLGGVVLLLVVSFLFVEIRGLDRVRTWRLNLIKKKSVYRVVKSRWLQAVPQLLTVALFTGIIYAGLFGSRVGNITPVFVWTIWWGGLIFAVLLLGPVFCFVCPWDGLSNLVTRLRVAARVESLSLGREVPSWLRGMWPAIILFFLLSWAELGLGVTSDPRGTAYMGLAMAAFAVATGLLFRDKAFCRHLCPVGRIIGMYSNFSPVEIRAARPKTCDRCETEDCLNGNQRGYACPTGISLKVLNQASNSTYCTGCTECIKSCDKNNVAINLRPFGEDVDRIRAPTVDEAWMCLMLLSLTLFHGFSMTTVWENFEPGSVSVLKWLEVTLGTSKTFNFSIAMLAAILVPVLLYWLSCKLAAWSTAAAGLGAATLFRQYAFSLLPVALFYHLAHNTMHVFMEGGHVVPMLSDPLGVGADYFGTAGMSVGPLLSDQTTWYIQVALIVLGHIFGIVVAHRISRRLFASKPMAIRSLVPMLVVMILISVGGLSLMVLDMNMRVGRM